MIHSRDQFACRNPKTKTTGRGSDVCRVARVSVESVSNGTICDISPIICSRITKNSPRVSKLKIDCSAPESGY
eukprot:COSAG02_NODE_802_length_17030_cov_37.485500_1_plen_73_part_00